VLLPGLDGSGDLFEPLVAAAPPHLRPIVIRLPDLGSYEELLPVVRDHLPPAGRFALLGESFSGPLAIAIAREMPGRIAGVILSNSFVSPPVTRAFRFLPWSLLFSVRPPAWVLRRFFLGRAASPALMLAVRSAIARTPKAVLAARMRAVFALPGIEAQPPVEPPVLFLSGERDLLVRSHERELRKFMPRLTVKTLAVPHLLLQAAPAEAWNAIDAFLRRPAGRDDAGLRGVA